MHALRLMRRMRCHSGVTKELLLLFCRVVDTVVELLDRVGEEDGACKCISFLRPANGYSKNKNRRTDSSCDSETTRSDPDEPEPLRVRLAQSFKTSTDNLSRNARDLFEGGVVMVVQRSDEVRERRLGQAEW